MIAYCWNRSSSSYSGVPNMLWILCTQSSSLLPGKRGMRDSTSKKTHPAPHKSILYPQYPSVSRHSGALYHLVEMYSVNGCLEQSPLHDPKSAILTVDPSSLIKMFSLVVSYSHLRLDVSMEDSVPVHMLYSFQDLIHLFLDLRFRYVVLPTINGIIQVTIHQLEHQGQSTSRFVVEYLMQSNNVRMWSEPF